jgi:hypothetical protein
MIHNVAALYVDPKGVYPSLTPHWFDLAKDARTYVGPFPVVAHPPCAPWSRLRHFSKGEGRDCGPIAVDQVRKFGGVLEQPADSSLFKVCGLPPPFGFPDPAGGRTVAIYQGDYGHPAPKLTWLYLVGVDDLEGLNLGKGDALGRVASQGSRARSLTPVAFARVLLHLAARAGR